MPMQPRPIADTCSPWLPSLRVLKVIGDGLREVNWKLYRALAQFLQTPIPWFIRAAVSLTIPAAGATCRRPFWGSWGTGEEDLRKADAEQASAAQPHHRGPG